MASASAWASSTPSSGPSLPGTTGAPACLAMERAWALSPMSRMASGDGPMKVMPQARQISAKAAFSDRRPYPGWMASLSVIEAAEMMLGILR